MYLCIVECGQRPSASIEPEKIIMKNAIDIFTLVLQVAITFIVTFCIYMVFTLIDNDYGFDGLLGLMFFQPIIAGTISFLTILVCLVAGLPIRLNNKVNFWWINHFYISIIGVLIGVIFLVMSLLPSFRETITYDVADQTAFKQIPNSFFSISGWFLTTFSLLHIYPPRRLSEKIKNIFNS